MKNKVLSSAIAAVLIGSTVAASAIDYGTSSTLQTLVQTGGTLSIGDKVFSGFAYTVDGLSSFNAANIAVNVSIDGSGIYYLTWSGNISVATASTTAIVTGDLKLNYVVTASAGLINMIDQKYTGGVTGGTGSISIKENVYSTINSQSDLAHSHLDLNDTSDPDIELIGNPDLLTVNPAQASLYVTKDIALAITARDSSQLGLTTISEVSQSFHQTSVPDGGMTVMLLGAGLSCVAVLRRKMLA